MDCVGSPQKASEEKKPFKTFIEGSTTIRGQFTHLEYLRGELCAMSLDHSYGEIGKWSYGLEFCGLQ
jgi:hypothetical protein